MVSVAGFGSGSIEQKEVGGGLDIVAQLSCRLPPRVFVDECRKDVVHVKWIRVYTTIG